MGKGKGVGRSACRGDREVFKMAVVQQKSKEQKAKAAMSSSKGTKKKWSQQKAKEKKAKAAMSSSKGKKKKWSKGKVKEKSNMAVLFDKATFEKLHNEVPKYKMITPSILIDRLRISGSLARTAIKLLEADGKLRPVPRHSKQWLYTRATNQ